MDAVHAKAAEDAFDPLAAAASAGADEHEHHAETKTQRAITAFLVD
jgi:hypothetical protein